MLSLHGQGLLLLGRGLRHIAKALGGAAPHLFRPMYAGANMGHPSREEGFVLCSHPCDSDELHQGCYPNLISYPQAARSSESCPYRDRSSTLLVRVEDVVLRLHGRMAGVSTV
jgi:hypothetical protein